MYVVKMPTKFHSRYKSIHMCKITVHCYNYCEVEWTTLVKVSNVDLVRLRTSRPAQGSDSGCALYCEDIEGWNLPISHN